MYVNSSSSQVEHYPSVYKVFSKIYESNIQSTIRTLFPVQHYNAGIHSTMDLGKNHYHSGVISLLGKLLKVNDELIRNIAAIAEYSWTAIIVLDDIGDGEEVRRGKPTLWQDKGVLYSTQAAWSATVDSIRVLLNLSLYDNSPVMAVEKLLKTLNRISRGQLLRSILDFSSPIESFLKSSLAISCHLKWAVGLVIHGNPDFAWYMLRSLRDLQFVATVKNDLEDFFPPSFHYKKGGTDMFTSQVTYPVKILHDNISAEQKLQLENCFKQNERDQSAVQEVAFLFESNDHVLDFLFGQMSKWTSSALENFSKGCEYLPSESQTSINVKLMREWIQSYTKLGNPNLA